MGSNCGICLSKAFLTFITILTMGLITAALTAVLVISKMNKIDQLSDKIFYFLLAGLIISIILLCFGIYASCCGKDCAKILLAIFYLIFCTALVTCGVFLLLKGNKIIDHCEKIWTDTKYSETRKSIEKVFKCEGYSKIIPGTCYTVIGDYISKYKNYVSYGIFGFAGLIIIAAIVAFANVCCQEEDTYKVLYNSF